MTLPAHPRRSVLAASALLAAALAVSPAKAQDAAGSGAEVKERTLGDEAAPVTMIEYSSYTCPHCAAFHTGTLPELKERFVDTGEVKLVMREFPLDQAALSASLLAQCAGDRYFEFADAFFSSQDQWARAADPIGALGNIARLGGLSQDQVEACLGDEAMIDSILTMRLDAQREHDVQSTPTFVINGEVVSGNLGAGRMTEIIDEALREAGS